MIFACFSSLPPSALLTLLTVNIFMILYLVFQSSPETPLEFSTRLRVLRVSYLDPKLYVEFPVVEITITGLPGHDRS